RFNSAKNGGEVEIAYAAVEERAALRAFLRALRQLPLDAPWRATIWTPRDEDALPRLGRALRGRVVFTGPGEQSLADLLGRADMVVAASGIAPAVQPLLKGVAAGAIPIASRIPVYEEVLGDGEYGLFFEPGD